MSFWVDGPAETDDQRVEAWRQQFPDIVADVLTAVAPDFVRAHPPGSLASLVALEELVLAQLPDQGSMKNPAARPLIRAAVGYLGETLRRAGGGRWVWGRGPSGAVPCVVFDAEPGVPPLPVPLLVVKAVQIRDGSQFARTWSNVNAVKAEPRPADTSDLLSTLVVTVLQNYGFTCTFVADQVKLSRNGGYGWLNLENVRRKVADAPQDQWPALVADHLSTQLAENDLGRAPSESVIEPLPGEGVLTLGDGNTEARNGMSTSESRTEQREFALRVFHHMTKAGFTDVTYDPDEFCLHSSDGWVLGLGNIFQETHGLSSEERDERLSSFITALHAAESSDEEQQSWAQVRPLLRPVLRSSNYGWDEGDAGSLIRRPAFPFLDEIVVIDDPELIQFPSDSKLSEWGVTADEVFEVARQNLAASMPPVELNGDAISPFGNDRNGDDSYLPSMLLVPGWLAACTRTFEHRPVAVIPDNTSLTVAAAKPEQLAGLSKMVEQNYREATRPLSPQIYTLDDTGRVVPLDQMITDHPAVNRARLVMAVTEYNEQRTWLQERYDDDLVALYVAKLSVGEPENGGLPFSVTAWGEGVHYALPEADYVIFISEDHQTTFAVAFASVVEMTGIEPISGLRPTRYRAEAWPEPATLARLRAAASNPRLNPADSLRSHMFGAPRS